MARLWNTVRSWSTVLFFITLFHVVMCEACSPPEGGYNPIPVEQKIAISDVFAWGKVIKIVRGGYDYDSQYTVHFENFCTFKGGPLKRMLTIVEAGYTPGLCESNDFKVDGEYWVYLDKVDAEGTKLRPRFREDPMMTATELQLFDDVVYYCEVDRIDPPSDVKPINLSRTCPVADPDYPECIKYIPETTMTPIEVDIKKMASKPPGKPKDGSTDSSGEKESGNQGRAEPIEDVPGGKGVRIVVSLGLVLLCLLPTVL